MMRWLFLLAPVFAGLILIYGHISMPVNPLPKRLQMIELNDPTVDKVVTPLLLAELLPACRDFMENNRLWLTVNPEFRQNNQIMAHAAEKAAEKCGPWQQALAIRQHQMDMEACNEQPQCYGFPVYQ